MKNTYDELGTLTSTRDANSRTWRFVYDAQRNRVAQVDARGHLVRYTYDRRNQRTGEFVYLEDAPAVPTRLTPAPVVVPPNATFTAGTLVRRWAYDDAGDVRVSTDAKGQTCTHVYGVLGRLESKTYGADQSTEYPKLAAVTYGYTGNGELERLEETKRTSPVSQVTEVTRHDYDAQERRITTTRYDGQTLTFGYDTKGNRTSIKDSVGDVTAYTYDAVDRLETAVTNTLRARRLYWPDGLLRQVEYGTAFVETRDYDDDGRLVVLQTPQARFGYGYDSNGNRDWQRELRGTAAEELTSYGYDDADRLVGVRYPDEAVLYALDEVGNRVGEKKAPASAVAALTVAAFAALASPSAYATSEYNAADWLVARQAVVPAGPPAVLTYDANGNRLTEGTRRYAWGVRDTLTAAFEGAVEVGRYDYDAALQRVKADTAAGHVEYLLDGKYVVREGGARTRRYHYGEGEALGVKDAAGERWLLDDGLGSVSVEVSAAGATVQERRYDAWGNYRGGTAPRGGEVRLGYTGHQYDVETGLTYARARYYDAKLGVFLSRDTFEGSLDNAPSLHRYAYAHANPLIYIDPSGRFVTVPAAAVGAVVGGVFGFLGSLAVQAYKGEELDFNKAALHGVGGAVSGFIGGLTVGASLWVEGAAVATGAAVGGMTSRALTGEAITGSGVAFDVAVAVATFGVVKGVSSLSANGQMSAALKEVEKEWADGALKSTVAVTAKEASETAATQLAAAKPTGGQASLGAQAVEQAERAEARLAAERPPLEAPTTSAEEQAFRELGSGSGMPPRSPDMPEWMETGATSRAGSQTAEEAGRHGDFHGPWRPLPERQNWGDYLRRLSGTSPPQGMSNPHAHHVVFKEGAPGAQRSAVELAQEILKKRAGIDPIWDQANLAWAPNKGHTTAIAQDTLSRLRVFDAADATPDEFRSLLEVLGMEAAKR